MRYGSFENEKIGEAAKDSGSAGGMFYQFFVKVRFPKKVVRGKWREFNACLSKGI
jgi:hypothetical protein